MATVSWNECPYLHWSPVMGASLLGWLERAGVLFKEREDKRTVLTHLCSWISRSFFSVTVLSRWKTSGQLILNGLLLWLQTTTFPWDLQKTYFNKYNNNYRHISTHFQGNLSFFSIKTSLNHELRLVRNLRSGIRLHCSKHRHITLNESCHCIIHHTSVLIYLSAIIPLGFRLTVRAFQDQLRDTAEKTSTPVWSKQIPEVKYSLNPFWLAGKKEKRKREICAGFLWQTSKSPVFVMLSGSSLRGEQGF